MFLIVFVKTDLKPLVCNFNSMVIAKGKFGFVGNKGGMCITFSLYGRVFNFIGGHLIHNPKNYIKRN